MLVERLRNAEYGKIMIPWTILVLLFVLIRAHAVEAEKAPGDDMICIPAEEFLMGSDTGDPDEKPVRSVYLDTFYIDRHEVTNADFQRFVEETGYVTDAEKRGYGRIWARTWKTIFNASWRHPEGPESDLSNRMDHPVVQVSWHDANAYCRWAGKRLPKEAEWEKTCRGPKGRRYPWGPLFKPGYANTVGSKDGYTRSSPVGSFPSGASSYGALDMSGNVWEWTDDWYNRDRTQFKVLRGGSWNNGSHFARCTYRDGYEPSHRMNLGGFRCARDAPSR